MKWFLLAMFLVNHLQAKPVPLDYGAHPQQRLDYYATKETNAPLVVYVHGGAWVSGSKEIYAPLGEKLAQAGVATALVSYRLTSEEKPVRYPGAAKDVAQAIDKLLAESARLKFDSKRVAIMGHSAGAHIAASLATDPQFAGPAKNVARFIGLEGIYDVPNLVAKWPSYKDWFVTLAFGEAKAWPGASPTRAKAATGAWLLVHSTADELVDPGQTTDFAATLKRLGRPVRTEILSRGSHSEIVEQLVRGGPLLKIVMEFISRPR